MLQHGTESIVWETDCGLLIAGDSDIGLGLDAGDCSFGGICYSVENGNPLVRCPFGRKDCSAIPKDFILPMCPCHCTSCAYDYEQSMERVQAEANTRQKAAYMSLTGGRYCACVEVDNGKIKATYDVGQCIRNSCKNEYCVLRREKRDLRTVNIYYDVRRTWITRTGLLEDTRIKLTISGILDEQEKVNAALEDSEISISLPAHLYATVDKTALAAEIRNDSDADHYRVELRRDDTGAAVTKAVEIAPGATLLSLWLTEALPYGDYPCTATVTALRDGEAVGTMEIAVTIHSAYLWNL